MEFFCPQPMTSMSRMAEPVEYDNSSIPNKRLDIRYGALPEQKLDIYLPAEGKGPWPVIIYVHGGGWNMGTKRIGVLGGLVGTLAKGYAVISVDYRLAPETVFPEFLYDVKTAIRWARANAAEYGFDPARFALLGDSAGAQLCLTAAFTADLPEYEGEKYGWEGVSSAVAAVIDMYGPSALYADNAQWLNESGILFASLNGEGKVSRLDDMMKYLSSDPALLPMISPLALVHKDIPPVLILHGESDHVVPVQHAKLLRERITKVCGADRVEVILYPERVHADKEFSTDENAETVVSFLDRVMK